MQSALETDQFPTAMFELTEPIELGAGAADGEAVTVDAVGDLTIHGVTQQVTFPLEAQLVDGTVVVVGSLDITFADYGVISAPELPSFEIDRVSAPSPTNPMGVKGVGETGTIASTVAVMNAVVDALQPFGVADVEMPASPERVLRAIEGGAL